MLGNDDHSFSFTLCILVHAKAEDDTHEGEEQLQARFAT